jgi:uncharacterized protein (DUF2062 family)
MNQDSALSKFEERSFLYRKFWLPVLGQLRQGSSPERLAWSVAAGATLSTFPILGTATLLCFIAGTTFKLNHVTLQAVNYLFTPAQLAAIPVLIWIGETLCGIPHITFNPVKIAEEFATDRPAFFQAYGASGLAGIVVWLVLAPILFFGIRALFLPILRRKAAR